LLNAILLNPELRTGLFKFKPIRAYYSFAKPKNHFPLCIFVENRTTFREVQRTEILKSKVKSSCFGALHLCNTLFYFPYKYFAALPLVKSSTKTHFPAKKLPKNANNNTRLT
jgi:hypothetical protein